MTNGVVAITCFTLFGCLLYAVLCLLTRCNARLGTRGCQLLLLVSLTTFALPFIMFDTRHELPQLPEAHALSLKPTTNLADITPAQLSYTLLDALPWLLALIAALRVIKLLREMRRFDAALAEALRWHPTSRQKEVEVNVYVSDKIPSALVFGVLKPKIYLPAYITQLSSAQQQILLCHEQTHIAHGDSRWLMAFALAKSCFWFNPLYALLWREYREAMELRCDANTVKQLAVMTGKSMREQATEYAQTLLQCFKFNQNKSSPSLQAYAHTCAIAAQQSASIHARRFRAILTPTSPKPTRRFAMAAGFAGMLVSAAAVSQPVTDWAILALSAKHWQAPLERLSLSSGFATTSPFREGRRHSGADFVAPTGTPVYAVRFGKVLIADDSSYPANYGKVVVIEHGDGYRSLYAHLDEINVSPGTYLQAGQILGTVGATGRVTGPHLHLEVHHNNLKVDPLTILTRN
ncbi:peptidoglycan DD-metalloendopeptidase family protein [Pseudoalteromonas fenneropenaei]|uniref:Peptidoglycan DD-metalloendopeptidase family protein n=1 Tax=Pseudoalteromonas fenneropenaei TaxID=1737459 RepID=A0ABV7CI01_9GAMM